MEQNDFIQNFAAQFDDTDPSEFTPELNFKDLEEWSSLNALSVIAMVDEEYDVKLSGKDIRDANTINDLYELIVSRK